MRFSKKFSEFNGCVAFLLITALSAFSVSANAAPRSADILEKYFKLDQHILKLEQQYFDLVDSFWDIKAKDELSEGFKESKKLVAELEVLYKKRDGFIKTTIEKVQPKEIASFNETVLAAFVNEVRKRRKGGYPEQEGTQAESRDKKRCPDIISDHVLREWAMGLAEARPSTYGASLARIFQGLECYTMAEALTFGGDLVLSFEATENQFGHNKAHLNQAQKYLLASVSNLFVIVQDITKAYGPSKMYQFLKENRREIGQIFMDKNHPIHVAGYWLYDLRLDRLVSVGPLCETFLGQKQSLSNAACVSATASLDALIDPKRLGLASCLLIDMITPNFDPNVGYICQRDVCATGSDNTPLTQHAIDTQRTAYQVPIKELQEQRDCTDDTLALGESGGILGLLGDSSDYMQCVTDTLLADSNRGQNACFVSAVRQDASMRLGFSPPPSDDENCSDPLIRGRKKNIDTKLFNMIEAAIESRDPSEQSIIKENLDTTFEIQFPSQCEDVCLFSENGRSYFVFNSRYLKRASDSEIEEEIDLRLVGIISLAEEQEDQRQLVDAASRAVADATDAAEDDADESWFCWAWEDNCPPDTRENDSGNEYCHPDVGDCNSCSALSGMQQAALDCFATNESAIPRGPSLPELIEPVPWDDPNNAAWAACLEKSDGPDASLICGDMECEEGKVPGLDENGICKCQTPLVPITTSSDDHIDCPQGTFPVVGAGGILLCSSIGSDSLTAAGAQ